MARAQAHDSLLARRAELMSAIEAKMDKVGAHPNAALADEILALSRAVDAIDRKLAAAARRKAERESAPPTPPQSA